ncbi:hypothetical protein TWF281_001837 [Arthrobotrys megalospora]
MQAIPGLVEPDPISLSSLEPSVPPKSEITATVASLWPYSSSALKLTAIIVELDYRKRENRGELKVSFHGYAAESLKTLAIGNVVKISLEGAAWEALPDPEERDVPWQLKWEKRLRVRVYKDISTIEPKIDIDKTFDQANRSGIFDRIAAAEAIINESQLEQDEYEGVEAHTPLKPSQLPTSWSTSFRDSTAGGSQTPINIFAQGRRRLFSLSSDDEEEDIDADRTRKKPRLFEPHQSFRYISDSPGDKEEEEEEEPQFSKRTEDQFFDENSFRESFRGGESAPTPRLYVRPDDAGDVSTESQSNRVALGDKPRGSKLYVRPDNAETESGSGLSTQPLETQATEDQEYKGKTADMDDEIFRIIFGQQPESLTVEPRVDEDDVFSRSLTEFTSQETFSTQIPLVPQGASISKIVPEPPIERSTTPPFPIEQSTTPPFPPTKSTTPPFTTERSFTPPFPETLRPVEVDSQPMSSFTLDASQASRPIAGEMPPPLSQAYRAPRLDTLFSERFNPITPVLKPTASPALPLPSPFPSSALEKGTVSFFPSRLSQSFASSTSEDTQVKTEDEQPEAPVPIVETAKAAVEQLEKVVQMKQEADIQGNDTAPSIQATIRDDSVEKTSETTRETIIVVEHASSVVDPEGFKQVEIKSEDTETKTNQPIIKAPRQEVIEILDSSEDEDEGEDEEYDEEYEEGERGDDDENEEDEEEYEEEEERRGSQERYEEALAAENDEDDYSVEDDEYPREGELVKQEGELAGQEEEYSEPEEMDEDEMEHKYRPHTPSPDIEERESPFVSDDDEEYRSPKVGESLISARSPISYISPSHRTIGIKAASPPLSIHKQEAIVIPGASALRGSVLSHPQKWASESRSPTTPKANHRHPSSTTKSTVQLLVSPEPYVPHSSSSSPSQPRTPQQTKRFDIRMPTLEDNGFEFVESPENHKAPLLTDANDEALSQTRKKRMLPWLTPQVAPKPTHDEDHFGPNSVPDKLRTPAADTKTAIQVMIERAKRLRAQDSAKKPILKPKLDINPDAIRKLREYNAASGVSGGVITPLSEFPPLQKLQRLEWEKCVDLFAVNLREGEVLHNKNPPNFFQLKVWIIDPSCANGKPFPVILTRPYQAALPKTVKPGDVLLLRNIKVKSLDNQRCGFSTMSSGWKLWRPRRAPDGQQQMVVIPHDGPNAECGAEEVAYMRSLWEWWKGIDVDIRVYLINKKERPRKSEVTAG